MFALRDFTDEHESRTRRENAERLQGVELLAAGIAHDFNKSLTVIVGFSEQFPKSDEKIM
ncbi:MAG: signal transduction histidine kinase [Candidatus Azotimanducaceae bacterium]